MACSRSDDYASVDSVGPFVPKKKRSVPNKRGLVYVSPTDGDRDFISIAGRKIYLHSDLEDELPPIDGDVLRSYRKQVKESEGFDIADFPGHHAAVGCIPSDLTNEKLKELVTNCAIEALNHYNKQFKTQFVFSRVLWATHKLTAYLVHLVTFEAAEGGRTDDPAAVKIFQAKTFQRGPSMEVKVEFCRLRKEQEVAFEPFSGPQSNTRDPRIRGAVAECDG